MQHDDLPQIYINRDQLAAHIGRCTRLINVDVNNGLIRPCPKAKGIRGMRFTLREANRYIARKFPHLPFIEPPQLIHKPSPP